MRRRQPRSDTAVRIPESGIKNNVKEKNIFHLVRRKGKLRLVKDYVIDYTENSNLHGLKYIGDKERTTAERMFWLLMFICCVGLCTYLISKVWIKWNESPVIVSFAEKSTPVWQIPYPAVTVCFETKAMPTRFNFTKYFHLYYDDIANLTEEEKHMFEDVSMVCKSGYYHSDSKKFTLGNITVGNIMQVSPSIKEIFRLCKWGRLRNSDCTDLFSPILTEEGLCFTFNTLAAEDLFREENLHSEYEYLEHRNSTVPWTLESGYPPSTPLLTYPHRGSGNGVKGGLEIILLAQPNNLDYLCGGPAQGFKVMLHNPAELPRLSQQYFRLPLSQEVVVAVKPKMMTTSEGLRAYDSERRQCYFPSDRYLLYFKVYTQTNCEMECLSNFTYALCGCVHFGMPHGPDIKVCYTGSMKCIRNAQMELVTIEIQSGIAAETADVLKSLDWNSWKYTNNTLEYARSVAERCHCLPACTSLEYEAETSQSDLNWEALFKSYEMEFDSESPAYTRVMIYFKEAQFITSRRSELYGLPDFLANCGGLLGLFMGFSILSIAEIIYFLTLRLYCVVKRRRIRNSTNRDIQNSIQKT